MPAVRRLAAAILLSATPLAAQTPGPAPAPGGVTQAYRLVTLAAGVYAFVAPSAGGGWVSGNSLVVVGDSGVLVVDAGHFPTLTRRMIADVRRLTPQPVRWLVNTHWHPDHWTGNAEYAAAFPGVTIVSTEAARREIVRQEPKFFAMYRDSTELRTRLRAQAEGKGPDGAAVSDDARRYARATLDDLEGALAAWRTIRAAPPTITFDGAMTVRLGGARAVELRHLGRGNTDGDLVAWVPDAKVVATGDLVVAPTPYAYGSFVGAWPETLDRVRALGATIYLPGHGPVQRDDRYLRLVAEALRTVKQRVGEAVRSGKTLDEIRRTVTLDDFVPRFAGDDPQRAAQFRIDFVGPAVFRAYLEARIETQG